MTTHAYTHVQTHTHTFARSLSLTHTCTLHYSGTEGKISLTARLWCPFASVFYLVHCDQLSVQCQSCRKDPDAVSRSTEATPRSTRKSLTGSRSWGCWLQQSYNQVTQKPSNLSFPKHFMWPVLITPCSASQYLRVDLLMSSFLLCLFFNGIFILNMFRVNHTLYFSPHPSHFFFSLFISLTSEVFCNSF